MSATLQYEGIIKEITDEIGTQTLARFGLNIFSLNTYEAYGASVKTSNESMRVYNQHKNNPQAFGQYFEELDIGVSNIKSALLDNGEKTYTTDTLFEIQKAQNLQKSSKKIESLNPKDKAKFEFIMANYGDEVKNMDFNSPDIQALIQSDTREGKGKSLKNHTNTDTVTIDSKGNIIKKEQLKVIQNTNDLLNDKYLENNDSLKCPIDDYKKHKENLKKMIENPKDEQQKAKAQKALEMLEANNVANRLICENPRTTAFIAQGAVAGGHIAQAGLSDAVVVALSTLANGAVYEIKDALSGDSSVSIETRIKRLINAVIQKLKGAFVRGGGFGAIDVIVGILGLIFKSIAGKLKLIWSKLRSAAKSIYNAIYDYITGKTANFQECLKVIIKGLFSAAVVVSIVGLETKLEAQLSAIITPFIASFVAPTLSIIIGSLAVVAMCRSIDFGLDTLFGVFAQAEISKKRYEEIEALCQKMLPQIIADREFLEKKIRQTHYERVLRFDMSFNGYKEALQSKDNEKSFEYLNEICKLYGGKLQCKTLDDARKIVQRGSGVLKWSNE
ncbi:hypothetical protein [Helicobacter sp. MIT 01-3238]|uniref:hypothetical protein n=1 Tax=Helicobacter sp. MIT 01-3238 TaxID=398627 RepID=UPI000E1E4956|nr:hypothetical protein [Helicobacter sp. MIT 01-3238]RDU51431.1 hypothetical protein CQA40_10140 [Helicobacter sp. MIT 01-3238]